MAWYSDCLCTLITILVYAQINIHSVFALHTHTHTAYCRENKRFLITSYDPALQLKQSQRLLKSCFVWICEGKISCFCATLPLLFSHDNTITDCEHLKLVFAHIDHVRSVSNSPQCFCRPHFSPQQERDQMHFSLWQSSMARKKKPNLDKNRQSNTVTILQMTKLFLINVTLLCNDYTSSVWGYSIHTVWHCRHGLDLHVHYISEQSHEKTLTALWVEAGGVGWK